VKTSVTARVPRALRLRRHPISGHSGEAHGFKPACPVAYLRHLSWVGCFVTRPYGWMFRMRGMQLSRKGCPERRSSRNDAPEMPLGGAPDSPPPAYHSAEADSLGWIYRESLMQQLARIKGRTGVASTISAGIACRVARHSRLERRP
jgi:hypothetical protein